MTRKASRVVKHPKYINAMTPAQLDAARAEYEAQIHTQADSATPRVGPKAGKARRPSRRAQPTT